MKYIVGPILAFLVMPLVPLRSQSERSVWDAVYTEGQAARGEEAFKASCSSCHNIQEFTGDALLGAWEASTVFDLFAKLQSTMPMDSPGMLHPQQYVDVIAYLFRANEFPAGKTEMGTEKTELNLIRITRQK